MIVLIRITFVVLIVPYCLWAFFSTLVKEIGSAFFYAWLELRICIEEFALAIRMSDDEIRKKLK